MAGASVVKADTGRQTIVERYDRERQTLFLAFHILFRRLAAVSRQRDCRATEASITAGETDGMWYKRLLHIEMRFESAVPSKVLNCAF